MRDGHGRAGRALLLGGTSEIGQAILAALPLTPNAEVVLAGRDVDRMAALAESLPFRVTTVPYDATDHAHHEAVLAGIFEAGDVDIVISAAGLLTPQARLDAYPAEAGILVETNFTGHVVTLIAAAGALRRQGYGTLVVLSSIAAVRPRRSNFVYGAAKAGLDAFTRGLADSLTGSGVRVLLVIPGFVVGRMTEGMPPAPLATTPGQVARAVADAYARPARTGITVVWVPRRLRALALGMRLVPSRVWRNIRV
ncbi:MAG: SDR family NAD(P)-dependent oxidoreductase [Terracoccus sp.]